MPRQDFLGARRGTAALWASRNPVLDEGEIGAETDTHRFKIGDGVTHWADLAYVSAIFDLENVPVQQLRDTDANLSALTTPFLSGQLVYGQTTGKTVIGDGESSFDELPDLRKQFQNVVTVSKSGKKGSADFICSDPRWNSDDECIQAAIDSVNESNTCIYILSGNYLIASEIRIFSDIHILAVADVTFTSMFSDGYIFSTGDLNFGQNILLSSDVTQSTSSFVVQTTDEMMVGDWIKIVDNEGYTINSVLYRKGEIARIINIDSLTNTITIDRPLYESYSVVNTAYIQRISMFKNIYINSIKFIGYGNNTMSQAVGVFGGHCIHIKDCSFENFGYLGVCYSDCVESDISDSFFRKNNYIGVGYSIGIANACDNITISNCDFKENGRHYISIGAGNTGGFVRGITISECNFENSEQEAINFHATCRAQAIISLCKFYNCVKGIETQNMLECSISNNIFINCTDAINTLFGHPTLMNEITNNFQSLIKINNNIFNKCGKVYISTDVDILNNQFNNGCYIYIDSTSVNEISVIGNTFKSTVYGIYSNGSASTFVISNNTFNGREITNAYFTIINGSPRSVIISNVIENTLVGIEVQNSSNTVIKDNIIDASTIGVRVRNAAGTVNILDNHITSGNKGCYFDSTGQNSSPISLRNNDIIAPLKITNLNGYYSTINYNEQNSGTATITASSTSVVVSHGLVAAPTKYFAFPGGNLGNCWIDPASITATQMTIHCSTAPEVDTPVSWSAQV